MRRVLIATTNKDKFDSVNKIFKRTIFPDNEFIIEKLSEEMNLPDEKEEGNNVEIARMKANNAFNYLKSYNYDFIVGLDDALYIKGRIEPNIKEYLSKILYERFLYDGEEYAFNRAYCIVDKDKNIYEAALSIPEIYHPLKKDYVVKEHTYPLSQVSYPIGYDKPVCELSDDESTNYYLKYVKKGIMNLNIKH